MNWQPPVTAPNPTISAGLPGVHGAYGDRDAQFDAETRSFNGLFEEDDVEDDGTEGGAALEEVDDFDESETTHPIDERGAGEEFEEGPSDQEEDETSFSMGPNHLEFVTLPSPRRGFNADVANI